MIFACLKTYLTLRLIHLSMAKSGEFYQCGKCGNLFQMMENGNCVPTGEMLKLVEPNTTDAAKEKHVPVIEKIDGGYTVKVGSVAHPMETEHYITFIILETDDGMVYQKNLKPGEPAEMTVKTDAKAVRALEFCNKHGLWQA